MTIRRTTPKLVDKAAQTTSQVLGVQTSILPGHASVTDAVTRLQRERDLALHWESWQQKVLKINKINKNGAYFNLFLLYGSGFVDFC